MSKQRTTRKPARCGSAGRRDSRRFVEAAERLGAVSAKVIPAGEVVTGRLGAVEVPVRLRGVQFEFDVPAAQSDAGADPRDAG